MFEWVLDIPLCIFFNPFHFQKYTDYPSSIYVFKVNNKNTLTVCEIFSKLTIKTPEQCHWRRSGVFIVNFEQMSYIVIIFPLFTLNMKISAEQSCIHVYLIQGYFVNIANHLILFLDGHLVYCYGKLSQ